ncbi:hypothetical protein KVR01_012925 [Diaporthe batatas]|uniref:uncharacterized protein n=1 Tax=Diaporthe batatas TaxID=748121 RepID=UPI001D03E93A|nr:uncharacterized protein KVR01_012925 [Diaporthe batatas]KAG8157217.1 hypothetical protein KVR01_012925 [Diaporthe batatas]
MLTDTGLALLPIVMLWRVQTCHRIRMRIVVLFGSRILVPVLVLPSLMTGGGFLHFYKDRTWKAVAPMIWLQISVNMSLFIACVPSLRGVIDSILVSTTAGAIQAPYHLTRTGGGFGVHATAIPLQHVDSSGHLRGSEVQFPPLNIYTTGSSSRDNQGWDRPGRPYGTEVSRSPNSRGGPGGLVLESLSSSRGSSTREPEGSRSTFRNWRTTRNCRNIRNA